MALRLFALSVFYAAAVLAARLQADTVDIAPLPSTDVARRNAFAVFNAVHSAMRQWGAALKHNGMSAIVATVPEGQVFYHGSDRAERPVGFEGVPCEWLAFDPEHAYGFASTFPNPPPDAPPPGAPPRGAPPPDSPSEDRPLGQLLARRAQKPLGDVENNGPPDRRRGYFHTFRASRPLNILYLDGMSAGNSFLGTMDFQDGVILDWPVDDSRVMWERRRAADMCRVANEWAWDGGKIDGFMRTEAGFEIIYCDFREGGGLDVIDVNASPLPEEYKGMSPYGQFEFLRSIAERYQGLPSGRIHVDWSSMVSAFFYNVNLTNPDSSRPELPRLVNTTQAERQGIRARVREVAVARMGQAAASIDWQGVVDLVVTRFSSRLWRISQSRTPASTAREIIGAVLDPFYDYPAEATDKVPAQTLSRCTQHYLIAAAARKSTWTLEDEALYASVETVTGTICSSLFELRSILKEAEEAGDEDKDEKERKADKDTRTIVADLMDTLQWTTWKQCAPCTDPDALCLVAMFPWGSAEDHFHPKCLTKDDIRGRHDYWLGKHPHWGNWSAEDASLVR